MKLQRQKLLAEVERLRDAMSLCVAAIEPERSTETDDWELVDVRWHERIDQMHAEIKRLQQERRQICQHLVGRDDCKDVPGVVAEVLRERAEAQQKAAKAAGGET